MGVRLAVAIVGCVAVAAPVGAQFPDRGEDAASALSSPPGEVAVLRGLDKITAETRDFEIRVGESATFGSLTVTVHYCRARPPEEPPETFVALEVFDRESDGAGTDVGLRRIFSGWMFASNPALNPLEHPVFDVWPIGCRRDADTTPGPAAEVDPTPAPVPPEQPPADE